MGVEDETSSLASSEAMNPPAAARHISPLRPASPRPLHPDFVQHQIAKQRNNHYHSTSLRNMVATSVNRTALHPGGVQ